MKECNNCHLVGGDNDFYQVLKRNKKTYYHICKPCCAKQKAASKDYYRNYELVTKYGISLEKYREESTLRNNKCDICEKIVKTLHVDHSHTTGKIRGLLCGSCNRGLGLFQDSLDILKGAVKYMYKNE